MSLQHFAAAEVTLIQQGRAAVDSLAAVGREPLDSVVCAVELAAHEALERLAQARARMRGAVQSVLAELVSQATDLRGQVGQDAMSWAEGRSLPLPEPVAPGYRLPEEMAPGRPLEPMTVLAPASAGEASQGKAPQPPGEAPPPWGPDGLPGAPAANGEAPAPCGAPECAEPAPLPNGQPKGRKPRPKTKG